VRLDLVEGGKGEDKEIEIGLGAIFHSKVVNDQDEADGPSGISKEAGVRRLEEVKVKGRQKTDKATVT
jgi:hypothetical protein